MADTNLDSDVINSTVNSTKMFNDVINSTNIFDDAINITHIFDEDSLKVNTSAQIIEHFYLHFKVGLEIATLFFLGIYHTNPRQHVM